MTLRRPVAVLPLYAFVGGLALLPVALLVGAAIAHGGAASVAAAVRDPLNLQAFANSAEQGLLSAIAAVAAGYPIGVLMGRYEWRGRTWVRSALVVPFLLPSLVVVVGVEDLFGPASALAHAVPGVAELAHGLTGIVLVNVLFNVPLVALLTAVGAETSSPELEETMAILGATPGRVFRESWGRSTGRGALAGGLLTFLFSALAFAAPLLLCGPKCYTLEARVWSLETQLLAPGEAAILAGFLVLLLLGPAAGYFLVIDRVRPRENVPRRRARRIPWRNPRVWPLVAAAIGVLGLVVALLASVLLRAVTAARAGGPPGSAWGELFGGVSTGTGSSALPVGGAAVNSIVFALSAAAIATGLALLAVYDRRPDTRAVLRLYLFVPLLASPIVLAFAVSTVWGPIVGGGGQVWLLILLSQAVIALPFTLQALDVGVASVPPRARETAQSLGASPFTAYLESELPHMRGALRTAALFAFALGLGEFTATYFLATPQFTTLPVALYHFTSTRSAGLASALAGLLVAVSLLSFLAVQRGEEHGIL